MTIPDVVPRSVRRWALRWIRTLQHAARPPAMIRRVSFVNYATYLGKDRDALSTADGPVWMAVAKFGPDAFRLDHFEARDEITQRVAEIFAAPDAPVVLIDRSLLRGFGAREPSHPAHHSSFSIWVRMNEEERRRLEHSEVVERDVRIHRDAYV